MENKIIFGYDRKDTDYWIPNGWPLSVDTFIPSVEDYIKEVGHWPAVYSLGVIAITNKQLISDLGDKPFLYYVEQFGDIMKVVGNCDGYEDFGFLNNMLETTKKKIQNKQGVIIIVAHTESTIELRTIRYLHNSLVENNISPNSLGYVMGNNWSILKQYNNWCDKNNIKEKITLVSCYEQLYSKGYQLLKGKEDTSEQGGHSGNTFVSDEEFHSNKSIKRKHQLVCLNRRIRPHRYAIIAMLHHNNLLENNLVSFSLETGKDLNCMGSRGKPDKNTMIRILGKTKLMHKYVSYYDELYKMSPRTVDFDNLVEILGTGYEQKQPYLDSYFSIVTETGFPEPSQFATEKIFRPILHFHPFIVYGSQGTLSMLKDLGFKTFSLFIDESYDEEKSSFRRMQKITSEVKRICSMSQDEMHDWYYQMEDILFHNRELIKKYGIRYDESQKKVITDLYKELRNIK